MVTTALDTLGEWARKHGVSSAALYELRCTLVGAPDPIEPMPGESEAAVQSRVRVDASRAGMRLYRNNIGAGKLDNGSFVRWGLANDSAAINSRVKSGDLIGIKPVLITDDMVGLTIGQFVSRECKHAGWRYADTERERAQLRWIEIVAGLGGDAAFTVGSI